MTNDEIGERGRLARYRQSGSDFRCLAEKLPRVSREARDTAGEAPALPGIRRSEFSEDIPPVFARSCGRARQALGMTRVLK